MTVGDIKKWYNQKHAHQGVCAWRPYEAYPVFLDYLQAQPGKKLLDIGCGTGHLLKAAAQKGLVTYGIDISEEGVKIAQRNSPTSRILVGSGERIGFSDNSFDYITCLGVLEHFLDMRRGLQEMTRVAKPDALFCIMAPNADFLYWKIKKSPGTEQQEINEHLLSLTGWRNLFLQEKLQVLRTYQDKWFARRNMAHKILWTMMPLRWTYQFVFILRLGKGDMNLKSSPLFGRLRRPHRAQTP